MNYELTTMIMIRDPESGSVLVQDRAKSWKGLSFPGGHVEGSESFVDCAVREVFEETGLIVSDLRSCGVIHWVNRDSLDRYLVFLYKTSNFMGALIPETEEGRNFWISEEELRQIRGAENDFEKYYPMFFDDKYSEAYGLWSDDEPWDIIYK